ncbi:beta' subunit [Perkinsus olseni]|uniref:Succinate--CoA ligase [ADP-forming] subunit beta, mitochondrial n=2 Tax=Perkinsus olseni TaxID=32597 RepID=A0A7J6SRH9_PEROL|nr:beta' subunit [Perkinsus olseni]
MLSRYSLRRLFAPSSVIVRHLHLHEYQSMKLLRSFDVAVPKCYYARTGQEAEDHARRLGEGDAVVKAQVLGGGRGRGYFKENGFQGGVHIVNSPSEARRVAEHMLGKTLITKQTGLGGSACKGVLLCERLPIVSEKYAAVLLDRTLGGPVVVASKYGGMSIEEVAVEHPQDIIKTPIDITTGLTDVQAREVSVRLGFEGDATEEAATMLKRLYSVFVDSDCTMLEINPLAELEDGKVVVCDAKLNFDDNAAFRQPGIHSQRDACQADAREVAASQWGLNYVGLDGSIGCMVNGAGLAMATMDLLSVKGGRPANFLDVGGSAELAQVKAALKILNADPKVRSILINIFGGIVKCDVVAEGVVRASRELGIETPIVIRLAGTNVEQGKSIVAQSGLKFYSFDDLNAAACKAVELSKA